MAQFIPGLRLSRDFYHQAVKPILSARFPQLRYSAGLVGGGSEVMGYDDEMSTDHHWGPRLLLFLAEPDCDELAARISQSLRNELPYSFMGYPTNFSAPKMEDGDQGTQLLQSISSGEVNHRVEILTIDGFMTSYLGIKLEREISACAWLSIPQQKLLGFTGGELFHDDLKLSRIRDRLRYYPRDVWLYLMACGWQRIGQDEHLAPRAGHVGDELGSAVIAGRLIRSIMQLCFLLERRYAPYPKWFGTAFAELRCAAEVSPILQAVLRAGDYREREGQLCTAFELLNLLHNALGLTAPIHPAAQQFHERGFRVSNAWRYVKALLARIEDVEVKAIAEKSLIGSIDQFSDNTDLREAVHLRAKIAELYLC